MKKLQQKTCSLDGQGHLWMNIKVSLQLEDISLRFVMSKYEGNPLTNNKIIAQMSRNQANSVIWHWRLTPFKGQGQIQFQHLEGVVINVRLSLSKYEDNHLNNKVIASNIRIQAHHTVIDQFKGGITPSWMVRPEHENDMRISS